MTRVLTFILSASLIVGLGGFAAVPSAHADTEVLSKDDYYDKTLAMLIGSNGAMLSGYEYVHVIRQDGSIDKSEPWIAMPDTYDNEPTFSWLHGTLGGGGVTDEYQFETRNPEPGIVLSDDDQIVDYFYQEILNEYGPDVTFMNIRDEFLDHDVYSWGGTDYAMRQMQVHNVIPNNAGKLEYGNSAYWISEPYIETETLGADFPGMPVSAMDFVGMHATMVGDLDNVLWGKFWAAAYAEAYFQTDARVAMDIASDALPGGSWARTIYDAAVDLHATYPGDWRTAVTEIVELQRPVFQISMQTWADRYADINNAFGVLAVLYGENDFDETVKIASLAGYDGDCTASTVGGLLAIVHGMDGLPEEVLDGVYADGEGLTRQVPEWASIHTDYPTDYLFTDLAELYQSNAEAAITAHGGTVGSTSYTVERQTISVPDYIAISNADFELGDLTNWQTWGSTGGQTFLAESQGDLPGQTNAATGDYMGTVITSASGASAKLFTTVNGLTAGVTYRIDAWIRSPEDREVRLYAHNFDFAGTYTYSSAVTGHGSRVTYDPWNTANSWAHRTLYVTIGVGHTSTDVGIELPPTSAAERWANIDDVTVQPIPGYAAGTTYEAEDFSLGGEAEVRSGGGSSGGEYVGGIDTANSYAEFTFNNPTAGEKLLRIHYANGGDAAFHRLSVNSGAVAKVQYPATGAWGAFSQNVAEVYLPLAAGNNTIRLQKDLNFAEIDRIDVAHVRDVSGAIDYQQHDKPYIVNGGVYRLVAKHSGKVLSVAGGDVDDGVDVVQSADTGSLAQRWILSPAGEGYFRLKSVGTGKLLDVAGGGTANGDDVWQWSEVDVDNQLWEPIYEGDGYFRLEAKHSGKVLDVLGSGAGDGTDVVQWDWASGDNQRWKLERVQDVQHFVSGATYRLQVLHSGKTLDIQGGSTAAGTPAIQNADSGLARQRWQFSHLGNGFYKIRNVAADKVLDIDGSAEGDAVELAMDTGSESQKWVFAYLWGGRYKIVNKASGLVLDVAGASQSDAATVWQWDFYDYYGYNQDWKIELVDL